MLPVQHQKPLRPVPKAQTRGMLVGGWRVSLQQMAHRPLEYRAHHVLPLPWMVLHLLEE